MNAVADVVDAHPIGGKAAIGLSVTLNGERLRRFRKRIHTTPNTMPMAIPPMMPPTMAGAFDLRGGGEGVSGADGLEVVGTSGDVEEGVSDVGGETINSGLWKEN